jgi:hypothetical protein
LVRPLNLPSHVDRVARIGDVWRIGLRQTVNGAEVLRQNSEQRRDASFEVVAAFQRQLQKVSAVPSDIHAASFVALTGLALTMLRAGLALNMIGLPLKGNVSLRVSGSGLRMQRAVMTLATIGIERPAIY